MSDEAREPNTVAAVFTADWEWDMLTNATQERLNKVFERLRKAEHENEMLTTGGIIEVSVRNPSVADYMKHWERRAETAEAEAVRYRDEVSRMRNPDMTGS